MPNHTSSLSVRLNGMNCVRSYLRKIFAAFAGPSPDTEKHPVIASILNPIPRRTALIKLQGPFTDRQLTSVAKGMVYLQNLGLISVIVVELDNWVKGELDEKQAVIDETLRVVEELEKQGARARPILQTVARLGPKPSEEAHTAEHGHHIPQAHTLPEDLVYLKDTLRIGDIPVLPPIVLDSFCRTVRIHSNDVLGALARGMVELSAGHQHQLEHPSSRSSSVSSQADVNLAHMDLTPVRLMVINREGGIPSYAREGLPHLLINVTSESSYIRDTFQKSWKKTHPTALSNLSLSHMCLSYMPPSSSAIMVSHRSSKSLIAHLITNKPEFSSSLPHALLQGNRRLTAQTPTILRRGLPVRVVNSLSHLDKAKTTKLLQESFRRTLNEEEYYERLEKHMDVAIIAGDYAGVAIVTKEYSEVSPEPIVYLDKFAVSPAHQGDGTVDFLWVALHDESFGLGSPYSVNTNGGKQGQGHSVDLVWRSREDNPVNKWYSERSSGHIRSGKWVVFWCDAENSTKGKESSDGAGYDVSYVDETERNRLGIWDKAIGDIPSAWK